MALPTSCPKCLGSMEEGFSLDKTHGGFAALRWLQGPPERSFWIGTKVSGRDCRKIVTYRCTRCGYLESYANELTEPTSLWEA